MMLQIFIAIEETHIGAIEAFGSAAERIPGPALKRQRPVRCLAEITSLVAFQIYLNDQDGTLQQ